MKIKAREISNPKGSTIIFLIPTLSYVLGKIGGTNYHNEWLWPLVISGLFILWFFINFKITKNYEKL